MWLGFCNVGFWEGALGSLYYCGLGFLGVREILRSGKVLVAKNNADKEVLRD